MSVDWITVAAQIANFLLLVWLLKRFLYRPILDGIDAREAEIAERMQVAVRAKEAASAAEATYQDQLAAFRSEQATVEETARRQAEQERDSLLTEAHERIEQERRAWQKHLDDETHNFTQKMHQAGGHALLELTRKALTDLADERLEARMATHLARQIAPMAEDLERAAGGVTTAVVSSHDPLPEALTRQIASMESIHSVVYRMKTLSVINSAPYEQAARAIEAYHDTVLEGLRAFLSGTGPLDFPTRAEGTRVVIVLGSDHGLCGNYNEVIASCVHDNIDPPTSDRSRVLCVGAQMSDALADRGFDVERVFFPAASVDGIGRLANLLTRHLDEVRRGASGQEIAVVLAYVARGEERGAAPRFTRLLPVEPALLRHLQSKPWQSRSLATFSMPSGELFQSLIRALVFARLVRAAAKAMVTENAARLALMQQAEKSVEDRLEALGAEANALRQSGITTELLDVIIGFEALKKARTRRL